MKWLSIVAPVRGQAMAQTNSQFTFLFYVLSAFIGSLSSVFLALVFLWALIRIGYGHFVASSNIHVRLVAAVFALYPLSEFISAIGNGRGWAGLFASLGAVLCFAILPVSSRLLLSTADETANAAGRGAALGGIITLLICLIQYSFFGFYRPIGGSGNSAVLAFFSLTLFCVSCSLLPVVAHQYRRLLILGAICCICAIIFANTRAAWIASILATGVLLWPMRGSIWRYFIQLNMFWKLIIAPIVIVLFSIAIGPRVKSTIDSFEGFTLVSTDASISDRIFMWRGGFEQFLSSPFLGYGPDSVTQMLTGLGGNPPLTYTHYHNIFLTGAIRGGIVEVMALVLIFGGLIWVGFKKPNNSFQKAGQTLIKALCVSTLVQGMTGVLFTHDITSAMFIFTVIIGLCLSVSDQSRAA